MDVGYHSSPICTSPERRELEARYGPQISLDTKIEYTRVACSSQVKIVKNFMTGSRSRGRPSMGVDVTDEDCEDVSRKIVQNTLPRMKASIENPYRDEN
jgi:hypothetical protein